MVLSGPLMDTPVRNCTANRADIVYIWIRLNSVQACKIESLIFKEERGVAGDHHQPYYSFRQLSWLVFNFLPRLTSAAES